jgi:spore germination protein KB
MVFRTNQKFIYGKYIIALLIGGLVVLLSSTSALLVSGDSLISIQFFPYYIVTRKVKFVNFEIIASIIFIFTGFFKLSIFLIASCEGVCKIYLT